MMKRIFNDALRIFITFFIIVRRKLYRSRFKLGGRSLNYGLIDAIFYPLVDLWYRYSSVIEELQGMDFGNTSILDVGGAGGGISNFINNERCARAKSEGLALIKTMENMARRRVIIGTPSGFHPPTDPDANWNPLQRHKSNYTSCELRAKGYKVHGQGLNLIYKDDGLHKMSLGLKLLIYIASYLMGPLIFFSPAIATHIVCVKDLRYDASCNSLSHGSGCLPVHLASLRSFAA